MTFFVVFPLTQVMVVFLAVVVGLAITATSFVLGDKTASTAAKKTTITCVKGKTTKKVTAVKPKCPSGYKKKA